MFWDKIKSWLPKAKSQIKKTTSEIEAKLKPDQGVSIPASLEQRLQGKIDSLPIYYTRSKVLCDRIVEGISSWQNDPQLIHNSLMVLGDVPENLSAVIKNTLNHQEIKQFFNQLEIELVTVNLEVEDYHTNLNYFRQLIDQLKLDKEPKIVVIPNLSNYFLRTIEGLQLMEYFFDFYLEDKSKFWIISCHNWLYSFLEKIYSVSYYFQEKIAIPKLSVEDIKDIFGAVLDTINFEWYDQSMFNLDLSETESGDEEVEKKLTKFKEDYFCELTKISQGNLTVAIAFFLRSLRYILPEEEHENQVGRLRVIYPDAPSLPSVSQQERYLLYCVGLHKYISKSDLVEILAENQTVVNNQINHLLQIGLIHYKDGLISFNNIFYFKLHRSLKDNKFYV